MGSYLGFDGNTGSNYDEPVSVVPKKKKGEEASLYFACVDSKKSMVRMTVKTENEIKRRTIVVYSVDSDYRFSEEYKIVEKMNSVVGLVQFKKKKPCLGYYCNEGKSVVFKKYDVVERKVLMSVRISFSRYICEKIVLLDDEERLVVYCRDPGSWGCVHPEVFSLKDSKFITRVSQPQKEGYGTIRQTISLMNGNILHNFEIGFLSVGINELVETKLDGTKIKKFNYGDNQYWNKNDSFPHFGYIGGQSVFDLKEIKKNQLLVCELWYVRWFDLSKEGSFELKKTLSLRDEIYAIYTGFFLQVFERSVGRGFRIGMTVDDSGMRFARMGCRGMVCKDYESFQEFESAKNTEESNVEGKSIIPERRGRFRSEGEDMIVTFSHDRDVILTVDDGKLRIGRIEYDESTSRFQRFKNVDPIGFHPSVVQACAVVSFHGFGPRKMVDDLEGERVSFFLGQCDTGGERKSDGVFQEVYFRMAGSVNLHFPSLFLKL